MDNKNNGEKPCEIELSEIGLIDGDVADLLHRANWVYVTEKVPLYEGLIIMKRVHPDCLKGVHARIIDYIYREGLARVLSEVLGRTVTVNHGTPRPRRGDAAIIAKTWCVACDDDIAISDVEFWVAFYW